jgi:hypothetical protein
VLVNETTEVASGVFLVRTVSQKKGTLELPELTLASKGRMVAGRRCRTRGLKRFWLGKRGGSEDGIVFGGLHLVTTPTEEIDVLVKFED